MSTPLPPTLQLPHIARKLNGAASNRRTERERPDSPAKPRHQQLDAREWSKSAPIICVCHLSWHWVWQRPQQFLSRFARNHPVLFVETYCSNTHSAHVELISAEQENVTIARLHLPASRWSDGAFIDAERRRVLKQTLSIELDGKFDRAVLWMYDPMAVKAYAGHLNESLLVYDCMDELSQFHGAPPELVARERELLGLADVVFCGGQKMRQKRLPNNANTHFFGTGVDCDHFGTARSHRLTVAPEIAALSKPVLGYFGVIDERIDYELLAKLADTRPDWSIAMVGPTAKVDPAKLPQRPNLHWLGPKPYKELPALTKGFTACLMPFALNAATEFINPTKALEYMATGRPVISTKLDEVRMNFGGVAHIAGSHEEFIALCERETRTPSRLAITRGLSLAANNTWESIVAKMEAHMEDSLRTRATEAASRAPSGISATQLAYV